ncbi:hypothetical protein J2744_001841 [Halorubrum trapanicum]|uniref:Uncharacterized protein n=1 Tax=Halorubrum trapanicum TaxID=29284 RepID=A0A8J7RRQ7_9EURY|nr:hypothetical protein [Halorubrum trapanicum]MBP1902157.1 hypothetical protein [Halorubrum trapanicum]
MGTEEHAREMVVSLYLSDTIGFDALAESVGRQDAEAVRTSKELLDGSESLADEFADL